MMFNKREQNSFLKLGFVPSGLSYISGALKQAGYTTEGFCNGINDSPEKLFDRLEKKPDVFAVSVTSGCVLPKTIELIEKIKNKFQNSKIIVGGMYFMLFQESKNLIFNKNIDAICIGEGEQAIVEYIRQVESGRYIKTDNLWIKPYNGTILKCDKTVIVEDINSVPIDRRIWDNWFANDKKYSICLQRGCPNKCVYCVNPVFSTRYPGKYLRYRNIESVINELKEARDKFSQIENVEFNAENAFSDMDYFFRLCEELKKFNMAGIKKFNFEIVCNCTSQLLKTNQNIGRYLREAGIKKVTFSLESGSLEIRNKINRPYYTNDDIINFCSIMRHEKIITYIGIMYCYPFETNTTYKETVDCINKCKPDMIQLTFLRSLPYTKLNEYMEEHKIPLIKFKDIFRFLKMSVLLKISFSEIIVSLKDIKAYYSVRKSAEKKQKYRDRAKFYFDKSDFKKAVKFFSKFAEQGADAWVYGDMAIAKMGIGKYKAALEDFQIAGIDEKSGMYMEKMEECRLKLQEQRYN